jgi:hypothetical protein
MNMNYGNGGGGGVHIFIAPQSGYHHHLTGVSTTVSVSLKCLNSKKLLGIDKPHNKMISSIFTPCAIQEIITVNQLRQKHQQGHNFSLILFNKARYTF